MSGPDVCYIVIQANYVATLLQADAQTLAHGDVGPHGESMTVKRFCEDAPRRLLEGYVRTDEAIMDFDV